MSKKDIDDIKNKYEKIKKDFHSNNNISEIKKYIKNEDNSYEKYCIIKEIINTVCTFEKNINNIDYIINKIYYLYEDKNNNFIILLDELNMVFWDFENLYISINLQIKNISNKFNM
jgi:hypothetical protein